MDSKNLTYSMENAEKNSVSRKEMEYVYKELKVPHKRGLVITQIDDEDDVEIDCPGVFRYREKWYMTFVSHNTHSRIGGYRTHLAESDNLLDWHYMGCVFEQSENQPQCAAFPALLDTQWEGSYELESYQGTYWWSTMEGTVKGYEGMPMNMGLLTTSTPFDPHSWKHEDGFILSVCDPDVRRYETGTIYKSNIIRDPNLTTGYPFLVYYNAREGGKAEWVERIFMAGSHDMRHWHRLGDRCILYAEGSTITGDPQVLRMGSLWVMNLFVYSGYSPSYDTFAVSKDLIHWSLWDGEPIVSASESYDIKHAHKPWVVKHNGVVYHFYCARGENPTRGIALATSE